VQPLLLKPDVSRALAVVSAFAKAAAPEDSTALDAVSFCLDRLAWSKEKLNPKPLLDGADLIKLGINRGPKFKQILNAVRNAQLDGEIETVEQANEMAVGI